MVLQRTGMCLVALLAIASMPAWAEDFETRLALSPHTDGTRVNITGEGRAKVSLDGRTLTVGGNFHGLVTAATTAALYNGAGIGVPGAKAFDLTVTQDVTGSISGTLTLTARQAAELRRGHFYVQINSQKAPNGNLTGWLLPPHPFAGEAVPVKGHGFLPQLDIPRK